jgi:hypothetical protein
MKIKDIIIFKGKKYKFIHTRDITLDDIRAVFFPKDFYEKYSYLGSVPWHDEGRLFEAIQPLVIFMDYKAKPKWCPRWVLRFLHLFGHDNSIVRIRNRYLAKLQNNLTKGFMMMDYKTKWEWYDLRISIAGDRQLLDLSDAIERHYYDAGLREDLADRIKELDPNTKVSKVYTITMLREELEKLENITHE